MVTVFLLCLPSQIAKVTQNAWGCACGGDTGVNARHGLSVFSSVGVAMAFIFIPAKPSWLIYSQDGVLVTWVSLVGRGCSVGFASCHMCSHFFLWLLQAVLQGFFFLPNAGGNLIPRTYFNIIMKPKTSKIKVSEEGVSECKTSYIYIYIFSSDTQFIYCNWEELLSSNSFSFTVSPDRLSKTLKRIM